MKNNIEPDILNFLIESNAIEQEYSMENKFNTTIGLNKKK